MENANNTVCKNGMPPIKEINHRIFSMILPITIENVLEMVAGIISMGMVGRIDIMAISALGVSMQLTQIIWAVFKGITTGAAVFVAQYYGANEKEKMLRVIQQTLLSSIILVVILQITVYFWADKFLMVFNPSSEVLLQATAYLKMVSFGFPFLAVMLVIGGVLQGMGNAYTPMKITFCMNILNIIVAYVLIFGKLSFTPMGLKGAAIATAASQFAAAAIGVYILFRKEGLLRKYLNRSFFSIDLRQIIDIYKVGIPSAMEIIFWLLAGIILTRVILTFGEIAFAAHQLGVQAESISYMPAAGFGVAATTFIGQSLGAENKQLAKVYMKHILKGAMIITCISMVILLILPKQMMALLTNNIEVIRLGATYLTLVGIVQIPQNATSILAGAMRGVGISKAPMMIAGTCLWGIRVPLALLFTYIFKFSIIAIWSAMSIDLTLRFILGYVMYKKSNIYEKKLISKAVELT